MAPRAEMDTVRAVMIGLVMNVLYEFKGELPISKATAVPGSVPVSLGGNLAGSATGDARDKGRFPQVGKNSAPLAGGSERGVDGLASLHARSIEPPQVAQQPRA